MRYAIPILLWTLVVILGGAMAYHTWFRPADAPVNTAGETTDGRVFVDVPWEHLPDVDRFKLTDQNGNKFDSADLTGQAYVVSFFFASCPTFCLDLNKEIDRVNAALKDTDIRFLTLSVDPENDTPEVLHKYAEGFGASPERWAFLTGQKYQLVEVGEHMFDVSVDPNTHTDNILLVDKWGRYRDRFKWDQPYDMQRFIKVAKAVAAETKPPLGEIIHTRNAMAGFEQPNLANVPWIRDFHLTERSGKKFFSRDLTGEVWIANFFFSTCPGICKKQNEYLRDLQKRLGDKCPRILSITTDPVTDTPEHLREFATKLGATDESWLFCTGDKLLIERIGSEFFQALAGADHHSSQLFVVDRWGEVRGDFDWEDPKQEIDMLRLVENLEAESHPQRPVDPPRRQAEGNEVDE